LINFYFFCDRPIKDADHQKKKKKKSGVSHFGLAIYNNKYPKAKEEL
jgi:hypothetical protein